MELFWEFFPVLLLAVFGVSMVRHGRKYSKNRAPESTERTFRENFGWAMLLAAIFWAAKSGLLARLLGLESPY